MAMPADSVPSPEARRAREEARAAAAAAERTLDEARRLNARVQQRLMSNQFVELAEQVMVAAVAGSRENGDT